MNEVQFVLVVILINSKKTKRFLQQFLLAFKMEKDLNSSNGFHCENEGK
jgi:hypothetical protein